MIKTMTTDKLKEIIAEKGVENIRFAYPMAAEGTITPLGLMVSHDGNTKVMKCKITEERFKIKDNYKISLTPSDEEWYTEHFYWMDFVSLIERGVIKILDYECTCGNPEMGFNCSCNWMALHPGEKEFSCEFCGLYKASEPQCNRCEETHD